MGFDGFDSVDLVIDVEKVFGISIPDEDAEKLHTLGELTAYITDRIGAGADGMDCRCAGAVAFYRARGLLADHFRIDRKGIRPSTLVGPLLPEEAIARREAWHRLAETLQIRLPRLEHSVRVQRIVGMLSMLLIIAGFPLALILFRHRAGAAAISISLMGIGIAIPLLMRTVIRFRATHVPAGYETAGEISSAMKGMEMDRLCQKRAGWTRHEVWEIVQWSTARSAGKTPASIGRDTSWILLD